MNITSLYRLLNKLATTPLHPQWLANRVHYQYKAGLVALHNKRVLDVGSGNCNIKDFLAADNYVVRLDYPSTSSHYSLLPDVYADGCTLPFKNDTFDCVILLEVLEHIDKPSVALSEIQRVLKGGGKLLLSVPFCYPIHDVPYDYFRYSKYGIQYLLNISNLSCSIIMETVNPFVTIFQLVNLVLLLTVKKLEETSRLLALLFAFAAYPMCLINNFFALPFLWIKWKGPVTLGYYAEAVAIKK